MISLWLAMAAFQQAPMVEVTREERVELASEQQRVFAAVSRFGTQVGWCRRYMPSDQIAALEVRAPASRPADLRGDQALLDQVFYMSYQQGVQNGAAQSRRRDQCQAMVEDAGAILVDAEPFIPAIEAAMPPASERIWAGLVPASAREPTRAPRALEPLQARSPSERTMRPGAVSRPPSWAETPRLAMPSAARHLSEGAAHIECIVSTEGRARACRLLRESVEGLGLGEAALGAESRYRFHPRTIDGQPVEARATFTVRFRNEERVINIQ